jgi:leucyl/phenylalanyl-tRNA--protein transferase
MFQIPVLPKEHWFPDVNHAQEDGLLAIGGDLHPNRILLAYQKGIFPWFSGPDPLWWSPDPRFVLFPSKVRISHSMKSLIKKGAFNITFNQEFLSVITSCASIPREGQDGTWILPEIVEAYHTLHKKGFAHSIEVWKEGELVGGLYGILIGKVFCGESMFSKVPNASKYGFIQLCNHFQEKGILLIDCQVHTHHLESLGAEWMTRKEFMSYLSK